ncbi:MAG: hypothetical protein IKQ32_06035 [Prevotella sp.]|nr:hypothetical protein [Prevotella sp.]
MLSMLSPITLRKDEYAVLSINDKINLKAGMRLCDECFMYEDLLGLDGYSMDFEYGDVEFYLDMYARRMTIRQLEAYEYREIMYS